MEADFPLLGRAFPGDSGLLSSSQGGIALWEGSCSRGQASQARETSRIGWLPMSGKAIPPGWQAASVQACVG